MRLNESATRAKLIDPLLTAAGWNLKDRTQVDFEIPVDGYDKEPWNGITDYCLFHPSGEVLAVVEAKKTSRHARDGQEQLRIYLDKVAARSDQSFVPFGFMTNGQDTYYWDVGSLVSPRGSSERFAAGNTHCQVHCRAAPGCFLP